MRIKSILSAILIISVIVCTIPNAYANPSISIQTDKEIYSYGDFLSFTIQVSELTGESAILHIIDESGQSSSAIPVPITELNTVVPSPYPFESAVYPQGKYTLNIEYSGSSDSTEFELIDSGKIMIPFWVRDFSKYWYNDEISDKEFAQGIEFLINENIIVVSQSTSQGTVTEVKIPNWIKTSTGWWLEEKISDGEFAKSIEYLIKAGIIIL
ncbi:MAG TPA: hypothetical protein VH562_06000 [Nitrosopumilaceae archaeon]